ncbi:MAG: hypothetical protein P8Z79_08885 [Sedimentisphaerales bacterium]
MKDTSIVSAKSESRSVGFSNVLVSCTCLGRAVRYASQSAAPRSAGVSYGY